VNSRTKQKYFTNNSITPFHFLMNHGRVYSTEAPKGIFCRLRVPANGKVKLSIPDNVCMVDTHASLNAMFVKRTAWKRTSGQPALASLAMLQAMPRKPRRMPWWWCDRSVKQWRYSPRSENGRNSWLSKFLFEDEADRMLGSHCESTLHRGIC
jgi:hypothetical protein